ncbi:hypothetical protein [Winogradskyella sp. A3E31]|uniref:hypothetical protein n=1 Tax=Winogradskyella sp. A3E31 TaxID=3349637 RepID=UPI00398B6946
MKSAQEILTEISSLTRKIENEYPELYKHLDENPTTLAKTSSPTVDTKSLENYLQTLRDMVDRYKKES